MWRSKKFVIGVAAMVVLLLGSLGGIALAADSSDGSQSKTLLNRVVEILVDKGVDITSDQLQEAYDEARSQMQDEALDNYLEKLVNDGRITQEQANRYKTWLEARPDMEPYRQDLREWQQTRPQLPQDFKDWQQDNPGIPMPGPFGHFGGHGGFRGIGGMRSFGFPCPSAE